MNESELIASGLDHGDRCWFRQKGRERWLPATFLFSWRYDGVIARVYEDDPDDYIVHSLFLDLGDELRTEAP